MHKRIVLTGATQGIGLALLKAFAASGHRVAACGRNPERVKAIASRLPSGSVIAQVDVADADAVRTWAGQVRAELGTADLLINNAALMHDRANTWEIPEASFDALVAVNIRGVMHVLRAFLPDMVARDSGGVVVNVSSGAGRRGIAGIAGYCASKWAIEGLTKSLALELPATMAAVAWSPGMVNTSMLQHNLGDAAAEYPSPEALARSALPMLLGLSRRDNGQSLTANTGD